MRRSLSTLLAGLLAWVCAGAVEHSAASKLGDPSWAADGEHAALGQVTRADETVARPRPIRAADGLLGRCLAVSAPTLPPPSVRVLQRSAWKLVGADRASWSERSARGPPA